MKVKTVITILFMAVIMFGLLEPSFAISSSNNVMDITIEQKPASFQPITLRFELNHIEKKTSNAIRDNHLSPTDTWIGFSIGTSGPFVLLGANHVYSRTSLVPLIYVFTKAVGVIQDFSKDTMELYLLRDGEWSKQSIYEIGAPKVGFMNNQDGDILLMVHGIFTGDYLEWTEAATYIAKHNPDLAIYAIDYGTGYSLEHFGKWLDEIIATGITDKTKINILAHSQGGLISRAALEIHENSRNKVRRLITLATPHHGVDYGTVASNATEKLQVLIPELNDLLSSSGFLEKLNCNIEGMDIEYYFVAGTDRGKFAGYWNLADKFFGDLKDIVNDAVVERTSALGMELDLLNKRPKFDYAEFPVDHSTIMSDQAVLDKVLEWLN